MPLQTPLFGNKKVKVEVTDINIDQAMKALQDNKEAVDNGAVLWLGADEDGNVTHVQSGDINAPVKQNGHSVLLNALSNFPNHEEELPIIEPTEDDEENDDEDLQQFYKQQRQEISPNMQNFLNAVGCFFLLAVFVAIAIIVVYPHLPASVQLAPGLYFNFR